MLSAFAFARNSLTHSVIKWQTLRKPPRPCLAQRERFAHFEHHLERAGDILLDLLGVQALEPGAYTRPPFSST
jgi:hypothetical protein